MTVQQVKDRIASAQTAILAKSAEETEELKAIIGGGGATPAQLDEIGQSVVDLETSSIAAIEAISDNVAGDPDPNPQP